MEVNCDIREYYERDLEQIKRLERSSFIDYPWTDEDYVIFLRNRKKGHKVYVADFREHILGFMLVIKQKWNYDIIAVAVSPEFRGQGVGTQLINRLKNELVPYSREDIYAHVQWKNKDAYYFFEEQGFKCIDLEEKCFGEINGGCFKMKYELEELPLKEEYINR